MRWLGLQPIKIQKSFKVSLIVISSQVIAIWDQSLTSLHYYLRQLKTHKFDDYSSINVKNLKLRPILDQSNTFTYNGAKIVSDYLQPLAQKEFVIKDALLFVEIIKSYILDPDEKYVSYNLEGLFTSIPVSETINYIVR